MRRYRKKHQHGKKNPFYAREVQQNSYFYSHCNGSVCTCTQTEEYYVSTDFQTVYLREQTAQTPSLTNLPVLTTPIGDPLLTTDTWNPARTLSISTLRLCVQNSYNVTIAASTLPMRKYLSGIHRSSSISEFLHWSTIPILFDSPFPTGFNSPCLTWFLIRFYWRFPI